MRRPILARPSSAAGLAILSISAAGLAARSTLAAFAFLACAAATAPEASADVIVLEPARDATLYEDAGGTLANGSGTYLFAGNTLRDVLARRTVLAFDLGTLPAGAIVNSVSLEVHMSRTISGPQHHALHAVLADWGEGASNAGGQEGTGTTAQTGDATWIHTFWDTTNWTSAGGDYDPIPSASQSIDDVGFYTFSSVGMAADVQSWIDTPGANFGWILIGDEGAPGTAKRFDSRSASVSVRPKLTIDFTAGPDVGACCLPDDSCVVATATECSMMGGTFQGIGAPCAPDPCNEPTGACCLENGTCIDATAGDCAAQGGTYQGDGVPCTPDLCPVTLEPYVDALPIPAVLAPVSGTPGGEATYEVDVLEVEQQLHRDLPATRVWGYGGVFPGPTIEATTNEPVTVTWRNDIRDENGFLRGTHYLPVDLCMHGPNHQGPSARVVTHLHGGHVPAAFDGYPEFTQLPGEQTTYVYPNKQQAATLWYHDHALGITRLNVYLGLAGFYLVRDALESSLALPSGEFEIPLVIQDRTFRGDGSLVYPADWQDHFFGDKNLVNGKVWPFLDVKKGKYRFRLLNGANSRTYTLALSDGATFWQIGSDGGLLPAPIALTSLTLIPGERADVVIDFAGYATGTEILLENSAPAPFPGVPGEGVVPEVMKFVVGSDAGFTTAIPDPLRPLDLLDEADSVLTRDFLLKKESEACAGSTWLINGLVWDDVTEFPELGSTEVWRFINESGVTHPMHMHLVSFQVLDRQAFTIVEGEVVPVGPVLGPDPNEIGWKDTVAANPFEITRVIARFDDYPGLFAYHCHTLEHEDHEMMRQFQAELGPVGQCGVGAVDAGCDDPVDVLFLNGENGEDDRIFHVEEDTPLVFSIEEAPSRRGDGNPSEVCIYAWAAEPEAGDVITVPRSLGTMCFGPKILATRNPRFIWNSLGYPGKLGADDAPGPPPIVPDGGSVDFLTQPSGAGVSAAVTFQGVIEDACSQGTVPISITNGFTVRIGL